MKTNNAPKPKVDQRINISGGIVAEVFEDGEILILNEANLPYFAITVEEIAALGNISKRKAKAWALAIKQVAQGVAA